MKSLGYYLSSTQMALEKLLRDYSTLKFYQQKLMGLLSFQQVPTMTKAELENLFCSLMPINKGVTLFATSGSTGLPLAVPYSNATTNRAVERAVKALRMAGISRSDFVLNAYGHGPFPPGMFYDKAINNIGANLLPLGSGKNTPTRIKLSLAKRLQITAICCVPSYAIRIASLANEIGELSVLDHVKSLLLGGEPLYKPTLVTIQKYYKAKIYDQYGMAEAPMLAAECKYGKLHFFFDAYIPEIYNPDGGKVSLLGEGELTITSRSTNSLPILRYRTGDHVKLEFYECKCGMVGPTVSSIHRIDNFQKIKGVLCSVPAIASFLLSIDGISSCMLEVSRDENGLDFLRIYIVLEGIQYEDIDQMLRKEICDRFQITPNEVVLVDFNYFDKFSTNTGKIRNFIDLRSN